ncbi:MAG: DUF1292 domain-containing protein [Clostridia bacterium]|jgi:uncharacterized protein YrzB (UPF0473 family)|nr:DUF1292 domain-containing protein [Clostridia bacterium]MBO7397643.1 DUF1292 domain-containing protein [Clostridia bacterium]MBO7504474.1 DUF1292 domain-containing protein [Clostridia bacterium]MBO7659214.1 DUF1292 domain-containing protein [Clostridia bacterium]MBP5666357.1 DUF1292 domain-containing protein [Clostridia bacterium]
MDKDNEMFMPIEDEDLPFGDDEGYEDMDDVVTLYDEDGAGFDFQLLDMIPYEGENYAVLYPLDEEEDDGSLVILKAIPSDDDSEEETFVGTDDEEALAAVYALFKELHAEDYDFAD